jgi:hypothetical protein
LRNGARDHNLSYVRGSTALLSLLSTAGLAVGLGGGVGRAATVVPAASGGAPCSGVGSASVVARDGAALESIAFDAAGRLIYDDLLSGAVRTVARPGAAPRTLTRLTAPGGIVAAGHDLVVAQGNTVGALLGGASLIGIDPGTGARRRIATGLLGGNGLARAADGTLYSSDVPTGAIDRTAANGVVRRGWWRSAGGPNGLAVSADGRTLYANLSSAGRVVAIDTTTGAAHTVARIEPPAATPDGLAIDAGGRLYVALYLAGEVRRIDPATGAACTLARGLRLPTAIALAPPGSPFAATTAYVTTFGAVRAIPGAVPTS